MPATSGKAILTYRIIPVPRRARRFYSESTSLNVIASGGIRTGTDVAKALSLGASLTGLAGPILVASKKGPREIKKTLQVIIESLRNIMFLVGAESIPKLKKNPLVITGKTVEWLKMRGFQPEIYAKRGL